jgi:ERCC4-related helicase
MTLTNNFLLDAWINLPFKNFYNHEQKIIEWKKYASEAYFSLMQRKNIGLVAETASGKTIIAILTIIAMKSRTVFLAPTRQLAKQHNDLYKVITGKNNTTVFTGESRKRNWQDRSNIIIFATPQTYWKDYQKGKVIKDDFSLLIIDEAHKATKEYDYVKIAEIFYSDSKPIIALTASPGGSPESIKKVTENIKLDKWISVKINTPPKYIRLRRIETNNILTEAEHITEEIMSDVIANINFLLPDLNLRDNYLSQNDLKTTEEEAKKTKAQKDTPFYTIASLLAKYRKIQYAARVLNSECYFTFLNYYHQLEKDKSKAAKEICADKELQNIVVQLDNNGKLEHPKILALIDEVKSSVFQEEQGIIFCNNKKSARYLEKILKDNNLLTACLFGGRDKNVKMQQKILDDFKLKEIQFIIATSVVEEGLSLPEVDCIIHFTLPQTEISRLQRDGRTGRFKEGRIIYLMMDIDSERRSYYAVFNKLKIMRELIYGNGEFNGKNKNNNKNGKIKPPLRKSRKWLQDQKQMRLF